MYDYEVVILCVGCSYVWSEEKGESRDYACIVCVFGKSTQHRGLLVVGHSAHISTE